MKQKETEVAEKLRVFFQVVVTTKPHEEIYKAYCNLRRIGTTLEEIKDYLLGLDPEYQLLLVKVLERLNKKEESRDTKYAN